ncbi:unnamed protein product, partial [Prorocentrum cordatum]
VPAAEGDVATAMVAASGLYADVAALVEACSQARSQREASASSLRAGAAMDPRPGWGLGPDGELQQAQGPLGVEKSGLLVLAPMWLGPSLLQDMPTKPSRLRGLLETGRKHFEFASSLVRQQVVRGGRVLFELPWEATSRRVGCVVDILATIGMQRVRCDQCLSAQISVDGSGQVGPARRAIGFMVNDPFTARAVSRQCHGEHGHVQSLGGRGKTWDEYPPVQVVEIFRALRSSMRAAEGGVAEGVFGRGRELTISAVEAGPVLEELELLARPESPAYEDVLMSLEISRATCGLRGAGVSFDRKVEPAMDLASATLGKFSVCSGFRRSGDSVVRGVRWGGDFTLGGKRLRCAEFVGELGEGLLAKRAAALGPSPERGD